MERPREVLSLRTLGSIISKVVVLTNDDMMSLAGSAKNAEPASFVI